MNGSPGRGEIPGDIAFAVALGEHQGISAPSSGPSMPLRRQVIAAGVHDTASPLLTEQPDPKANRELILAPVRRTRAVHPDISSLVSITSQTPAANGHARSRETASDRNHRKREYSAVVLLATELRREARKHGVTITLEDAVADSRFQRLHKRLSTVHDGDLDALCDLSTAVPAINPLQRRNGYNRDPFDTQTGGSSGGYDGDGEGGSPGKQKHEHVKKLSYKPRPPRRNPARKKR